MNLDTTALIALTSNLSHGQVPTKDPCCIDQCFWGHFFFGPRLVEIFCSEFWINLFGDAGGLVLRRSCVGATGPSEVVHGAHTGYQWDMNGKQIEYIYIYRTKNTNNRILGYL